MEMEWEDLELDPRPSRTKGLKKAFNLQMIVAKKKSCHSKKTSIWSMKMSETAVNKTIKIMLIVNLLKC